MGKGSRFMESPATPEEDEYNYRVTWEDRTNHDEWLRNGGRGPIEHLGPGYEDFSSYDNAWDRYCDLKEKSYCYYGVEIYRIE